MYNYFTVGDSELPQFPKIQRLLLLRPDKDGFIAPSLISQKHICQRVNGSYPVAKAVELLQTAEKLGFGKLELRETPINKQKMRKFRKHRHCSLNRTAKDILNKFGISSESYEDTFIASGSMHTTVGSVGEE